MVPLEFPAQGKDFAPAIRGAKAFGSNGGVRAGLGELALMKAKTWLGRGEDYDMTDFRFLIAKMDEEGENFKDMVLAPGDGEELGDVESLTTAGKAASGCYSTLLQGMLPG